MKRLRYAVYQCEAYRLVGKAISRHATLEEAEAGMRKCLLPGFVEVAVVTKDGYPVRSMTAAEAMAEEDEALK